jgi:DNA-binding HxlR family transcriptional regulator
MSKYGQYCPVARALDLIGDRWTLLIVRDLLMGTRHFNELERGLPRISRALLAKRLRQLEQANIIIKHQAVSRQTSTDYELTQAGQELLDVIISLQVWGDTWAFGEPTPEELNPVLLMWCLRKQVKCERLPKQRVVVQFDFCSPHKVTFWLILTTGDVTICLTEPDYEIHLFVTAELAALYKVWAGRTSYPEVLSTDSVRIDGIPSLIRAFPAWFGWGTVAPAERAKHTHS